MIDRQADRNDVSSNAASLRQARPAAGVVPCAGAIASRSGYNSPLPSILIWPKSIPPVGRGIA